MNVETRRKSSQSLPDTAIVLFKNRLREGQRGEKSESSHQRCEAVSLPPSLSTPALYSFLTRASESIPSFPLFVLSVRHSARFSASPFSRRSSSYRYAMLLWSRTSFSMMDSILSSKFAFYVRDSYKLSRSALYSA